MSETSRKLMSIKNRHLKKVYSEAGSPTDEELLLLDAPDETDEIYRVLNIPSKKDHIDRTLSEIRTVNVYEKMFETAEVFKGRFIKELCHKYFLKIRKLDRLKGYLPKDAVLEIKKFIELYDQPLVQSSFYILTGLECFDDKYSGKEVKTYILFFVEPSDTRHNYNIDEDSTLMQFYSSGNDFDYNRIWCKSIDTKVDKGEAISMLASNILILLLFIITFGVSTYFNATYLSMMFILIFTVGFIVNNFVNNQSYKKYWNEDKN